jgi:dihydrofolate reductase
MLVLSAWRTLPSWHIQDITDKETRMRTLISSAFISLDGVMEGPGGETGYRNAGWTFKDVEFVPEAYEIKGREQEEAGAVMLGRVSYEAFSPVWPDMQEFARYKTLPKYVISTTLADADLVSNWGESTILRSLDEVAALKRTEGGPIIVHGSVALNHALSDAGLIDRYNLLVFPLLLGAGKRLFSTADKDTQKLRLVESAVYSNGVQKQIFDVVR